MISIDYIGRAGNNLFQWVFARLIAERNGLGILTDPPEWVIKALPAPRGILNAGELQTVLDDTNPADSTLKADVIKDLTTKNIRLHGYFQDTSYYNDHRDKIKSWFELPTIEKNTDDLVVHLRLTDYWWYRVGAVIHPSWYMSLIQRETFKKLYVVVEPHHTNKKYIDMLYLRYPKMEVVSQTAKQDFEFIRSFDRIICSNSTFAWWAAFLSEASKIYTFKPWMRKVKIPLSGMAGAKEVDGTFYRDLKLENYDWWEYWKK